MTFSSGGALNANDADNVNGILIQGGNVGPNTISNSGAISLIESYVLADTDSDGDFDGGFGAEAAPQGFDTVADLPRLADVLSDLGFTDAQIWDILGRNWIRFLERALPAG